MEVSLLSTQRLKTKAPTRLEAELKYPIAYIVNVFRGRMNPSSRIPIGYDIIVYNSHLRKQTKLRLKSYEQNIFEYLPIKIRI